MKRKDLEKAVEQSGMVANAIAVIKGYTSFCTYDDKVCFVWAGTKAIAEKTGISQGTVKSFYSAFKEFGWLVWTGRYEYVEKVKMPVYEICVGTLGGKLMRKVNQKSLDNLKKANAERQRKAAKKAEFLAKCLAAYEGGTDIGSDDTDSSAMGGLSIGPVNTDSSAEGGLAVRHKEPLNNQLEQPMNNQDSLSEDSQEEYTPEQSSGTPQGGGSIILDSSEGSNYSDAVTLTDSPKGPTSTEGADKAINKEDTMEKSIATLGKYEIPTRRKVIVHNPETCRKQNCKECTNIRVKEKGIGADW